jgi:hypothetical protein
MQTKSRIRNLSTRYFLFYKYGVVVLCCLAIIYTTSIAVNRFSQRPIESLFMPAMWGSIFFLWSWVKIHKKVPRVEFDDNFLYVIRRNQDTIIPLENIKDVEIKSLMGFYQIDLYNPEDFGSQLYFKPSLFYPFNFRKKDALVTMLRKNIKAAKVKVQPLQKNALHS